MNSYLLTLALTVTSLPAAPESGSLVVIKNSNQVVSSVTRSDVTHVALVIHEAGRPWIYEATPGYVRRIGWTAYREELGRLNHHRKRPMKMIVVPPKEAYKEREIGAMRVYLHTQVGRRYSVRGYVRKQKGDGIHCAELAANALNCTRRFQFGRTERLSPGKLYEVVAQRYASAGTPVAIRPIPPAEPWCARTWKRWTQFSSWCGWACFETWTFCW